MLETGCRHYRVARKRGRRFERLRSPRRSEGHCEEDGEHCQRQRQPSVWHRKHFQIPLPAVYENDNPRPDTATQPPHKATSDVPAGIRTTNVRRREAWKTGFRAASDSQVERRGAGILLNNSRRPDHREDSSGSNCGKKCLLRTLSTVGSSQIRFLADESRPHFSSSSAPTLLTDRAMTKCGLTEGDDTAHARRHVTTQLNGKPGSWSSTTTIDAERPPVVSLGARILRSRARDAEEAVKHYASERPAAVILDMVIAGRMDGLGPLRRSRGSTAMCPSSSCLLMVPRPPSCRR